MSHEIDTSTGRAGFAYVGQPGWHGLGNKLTENATLEEWRREAGLNWEALTLPLTACQEESEEDDEINLDLCNVQVPSHRALVRSDTKGVLGVVSANYKPVQPEEVMEFFSDLVEGVDAGFQMETAGCLRDGKKIFALARGTEELDLGGDKTGQYLLMATSFDRSLPTIAMMTSIRVVCSNTLHLATSKEGGVRITHNRHFDAEKVKEELGISKWQIFAQQCEKFADRQMSDDESRQFVAQCIAASNPHKDAEYYLDEGEDNKTFKELWEARHIAPGQQLDSAKGTLWGDLNAVTYWVDHQINSKSADNRIDSSLFGRGARVKRTALDLATALV